jgi:hypothetical protein
MEFRPRQRFPEIPGVGENLAPIVVFEWRSFSLSPAEFSTGCGQALCELAGRGQRGFDTKKPLR